MIFAFSGTGNSLDLAESVAGITGDEVRTLRDVPMSEQDVSGLGTVGFVFPVWYFDMPERMKDILHMFRFGPDQQVWAAMTYGTTPGNACARTIRFFSSLGVDLRFALAYRMPENYVMMFSVPPQETVDMLLSRTEENAREIAEEISLQDVLRPRSSLSGWLVSAVGHPFYNVLRRTRRFRSTDSCTGCGECVRMCPAHAIVLNGGRPVWTEPKCLHCAACINRCPSCAIEYGRRTQGRSRYVNPRSGYRPL